MVTAVTALGAEALSFAAPATGVGAGPAAPQLSNLAREALDGLSRMHAEFDAGTRVMESQASRTTPLQAGSDLAAQLQASREAAQAALKVQGQILQFTMATSISSTLGNNLNSFLKGA